MYRLLVIDMSKLEAGRGYLDSQLASCQGRESLDVVVDGENER